jgi:hypothetical protein
MPDFVYGLAPLVSAQSTCPQPYPLRSFYISPAGSDSGAGSQNAPWATFNHAWQIICPGDTLWLMDGTYTPGTTGVIHPNVRDGDPNPAIDNTNYRTYPLDHPERLKYYIKIKALHDGQAIIDGQYSPPTPPAPAPTLDPFKIPVFLGSRCPYYTCDPQPNNGDYFIIEGLVAKRSPFSVYFIQGKNVIIRRCSGYDGNTDKSKGVAYATAILMAS